MKRVFCIALSLILIFALAVPAFAEVPDFSGMSTDEIQDIITAARNELTVRELKDGDNTVLLDRDGVQVYLTGNARVDAYDDVAILYLEAVVIDDTGHPVGVEIESASVNGWDVYGNGIYNVTAKKKAEFEFTISDGGMFSLEEVEDVTITFHVFDDTTYDGMFDTEPVTVTLK